MNIPTDAARTFAIDPARLAGGTWCHKTNRQIGEGDISCSYSADRIGMGKPVRKPFQWKGASHVCVGMRYHGETMDAEAYRLVPLRLFDGEATTYAAKRSDEARADPMGFYHGMTVQQGGETFVLCGPPVIFVPGRSEQQLALF